MAGEILSKGERTRRRILKAAAHCIATIGIENTSITEIAKEAQTSRALVAHYVPKKSELFLIVIHWIVDEILPQILNPPSGAAPEEKILHNVRMNFEFFSENLDYYKCFMLFFYFAGIQKEFLKLNTQINRRAVERTVGYLEAVLKAGGKQRSREEIETCAQAIISQGIGALQMMFFVEHDVPADRYLERVQRSIRARIEALL